MPASLRSKQVWGQIVYPSSWPSFIEDYHTKHELIRNACTASLHKPLHVILNVGDEPIVNHKVADQRLRICLLIGERFVNKETGQS